MIPVIEVSGEAQASAALSLVAALIQKLVLKGILTEEETIDLYVSLADAKQAKARLHENQVEAEAAVLLRHLAERLNSK